MFTHIWEELSAVYAMLFHCQDSLLFKWLQVLWQQTSYCCVEDTHLLVICSPLLAYSLSCPSHYTVGFLRQEVS